MIFRAAQEFNSEKIKEGSLMYFSTNAKSSAFRKNFGNKKLNYRFVFFSLKLFSGFGRIFPWPPAYQSGLSHAVGDLGGNR
ncbi:MAG: hypothetical protein OXC26_02495 [Albidovulum sp.]|nr:hypothetical protein [Albidovulum sp.]